MVTGSPARGRTAVVVLLVAACLLGLGAIAHASESPRGSPGYAGAPVSYNTSRTHLLDDVTIVEFCLSDIGSIPIPDSPSCSGHRPSPGECTQFGITGPDGCVQFEYTEPGWYFVEFEPPPPWVPVPDVPTSLEYEFYLSEIGPGLEIELRALWYIPGNVTACKLEDIDGDPSTAYDRFPVPDWAVQLTLNGDVIDTELTSDDGCYTWADAVYVLPPDYYEVREVAPDDWYPWTPTSFDCDPVPSGLICSHTFVNSRYAQSAGYQWNDLNADGIWQQPNEPALSGWIVELWDVSGIAPTFVISDTTDVNGYYDFDMVVPGTTYAVCEVLAPGFMQTYPDGTKDPPADKLLYDCTALGTGYGPYGYQFSPWSGDQYLDNNFGNSEALGCTYTQGYWKTHSLYGPARHRDDGWYTANGPYPPGALGPDAPLFQATDYQGNTDQLTWLEAFNTSPRGGNAWFILAHQWMAAYLNYYNGSGAGGTDVVQWLSDGAALLDAYDMAGNGSPLIPKNAADRDAANILADRLDRYNSGEIGPGHCDD